MHEKARHFVEKEKEFHLGHLLTEKSHPRTRSLSYTASRNLKAGLKQLLSVDWDIARLLARPKTTRQIENLAGNMFETLQKGGRIFFTGCGATGRLAILLDVIWRRFWREMKEQYPEMPGRLTGLENRIISVMAAGDYALIRSVEGYEDYAVFGRRQMKDMQVGKKDLVIAVTEGGETSFVIGTAWAGLKVAAEVCFVYNNPDRSLRKIKRCREILSEPKIRKICLATGPMAISGSTRMQAVTAQLVVLGSALECAISRLLNHPHPTSPPWRGREKVRGLSRNFVRLLKHLMRKKNLHALEGLIQFEKGIYENGGLVTYLANEYALDILTDTTERSPTFCLPPFVKKGDKKSTPSWCYLVKSENSNRKAWFELLQRPIHDISWSRKICLNEQEILKFDISTGALKRRIRNGADGLVAFFVGSEGENSDVYFQASRKIFKEYSGKTRKLAVFFLGTREQWQALKDRLKKWPVRSRIFPVLLPMDKGFLHLQEHLTLKLCLNAVSALTNALLGRVLGNLMVCVSPSNKKLYDRATRYISQLTGKPYAQACDALFRVLDYQRKQGRFVSDAPVLLASVCLLKNCLPRTAGEIIQSPQSSPTRWQLAHRAGVSSG